MLSVLAVGLPVSPSPERNEEYAHCLERNIRNRFVNEVIAVEEERVLGDGDRRRSLLNDPKVSVVKLGRRASFADFLSLIRPHKGLKAFANADTYTNFSLGKLSGVSLGRENMMALIRDDNIPSEVYTGQDAWVFEEVPELKADFPLGYDRCDWAFDDLCIKAGIRILVPAFDIFLKHVHAGWLETYVLRCARSLSVSGPDAPPSELFTCRLDHRLVNLVSRAGPPTAMGLSFTREKFSPAHQPAAVPPRSVRQS